MDSVAWLSAVTLLFGLQIWLTKAQDLELLDNKGRINGSTFIVGFLTQFSRKSSSSIDSVRLYITADRYAKSFIQIPAINSNKIVTLRPGGTMAVDLPGTVRMSRITGTERKGIRIWTNSSVSVYGMNFIDQSSDGFLALPLGLLGNSYMVVTYTPIMHAVVMVIAALGGTEVTFKLKLSGAGSVTVENKQYRNGDSFKVMLDKHDSFQLLSDSAAGSLTGTQINSNKAVAVYSGNDCANVPESHGGCDHLVEQIPPLSTWGKEFLVKSTAQRTAGDIFVILASEDQTQIQIYNVNGSTLVKTINAGETYDFDAVFNSSSHVITASKPCLVVQYGKGHTVDDSNFAPFMSIIPSTDQFSNDYTLVVPEVRSRSFKSFANIFVKNGETPGIEVKTTNSKDQLVWKKISSSDYSTATVSLSRGQYRFYHRSPLKTFSMIFYGHGDYEAFAYPAGFRVYRPSSRYCKIKAIIPADNVDNDCDGNIDEELLNGKDDDGDGRIDEDLATLIPEMQAPSIFNETDCSSPQGFFLPSSPVPDYRANGMCAVRGSLNIVYTDKTSNIRACWEMKTREWSFTDGCLNKIKLNQIINVFKPNQIRLSFPSNKIFNCSSLPKDNRYGVPVVTSDCPGNVTMTYKDSNWGVVRDCGYLKPVKVTRTWTVTNVCGIRTSATQTLSFINNAIKPRIVDIKSTVSAGTDHNITLTCTTQGHPKPINTWVLPNGEYVNKSQTIEDIEVLADDLSQIKRIKAVQDDGSLLFTDARVRDSGVYRCISKNVGGVASREVNVTIHDDLVDIDASITIKDLLFDEALNDEDSELYRTMAQHMKTNLTKVFENMTGFQEVQIHGFRNGSVKVLFRVVVKKKNKDEKTSLVVRKVGQRLTTKVKTGQLGNYKIEQTAELREKPPPPQELQASEIKHGSVQLYWDPPELHHMFSVSSYLIQYKKFGDKRNWMSYATVHGEDHRVDGLDSGTSYLIRMKSKNKYGHSEPSEGVEVTTLKGVTSAELALFIVVPILVLVIIAVIVLIAWRKRRKSMGFLRASLEDDKDVVRYSRPTEKIVIDGTFTWREIQRGRLELGRVLGEGEFGMVLEANLTEDDGSKRRCAVKKLKRLASNSDLKDLLNELEIMVQVGEHKNIVNLIGACATGDGPLLVVVEFASNGSLLRYLQKQSSRSYGDMAEYVVHIPPAERLKIACDIANGMAHLARRRCIHRDLAARNILLDENWTAKVSDFGLSRDVYCSAVYEKTTGGKLPAKWMAIEAIEAGLNTTQSDVWSFGVVLWEIETGACIPYPAFSVMEMLSALKQGYRLEKPTACSIELYNIMSRCWEANPALRPSFDDLYIELHCLKGSVPNSSSSYYEHMEGVANGETDA